MAGAETMHIPMRAQQFTCTPAFLLRCLPSLAQVNWNEVNYILNHKLGTSTDVQYALWNIIDGFQPSHHLYPNAWTMINNANANPNYSPPLGGVMAVVCASQDWNSITTPPDTASQPLLITLEEKVTSTTVTTLSSSTITLGQSVEDTATVTVGATGQVQFEVSTDGNIFSQYGGVKTLSGGNPNTAVSDSYIPSAPGTYYFRAEYLGDSNYYNSQSANNEEPLTVNQATPSIATTTSTPTLTLGQSIHDTATVVGVSGFVDPSGSVTFWVSTDGLTWSQVGGSVRLNRGRCDFC